MTALSHCLVWAWLAVAMRCHCHDIAVVLPSFLLDEDEEEAEAEAAEEDEEGEEGEDGVGPFSGEFGSWPFPTLHTLYH